MNNTEYFQVTKMERSGNTEEAFRLLVKLSEEGEPLALLDLSMRYLSVNSYTHPVKHIEPDERKSEELALKAENCFNELARSGNGEAMRMLGNLYLGHWHPIHRRTIEEAEEMLIKAFEANCYFAANDLAIFYQSSDLEKAKYYYKEAKRHGCRVIQNNNLET